MSLDGALLSQIALEIKHGGLDARVDRIAQPSRNEIIVHLRGRGATPKLLLSASASNPRLHFTQNVPENPQSPPMFCMLLRKHLQGARLVEVVQEGLDRILFLKFDTFSELGDPIRLTLALEIMGRHSNIILIDQDNRIMDSIHRVDFETSSVRQLLPKMFYELPPSQDKKNLLTDDLALIIERIKNSGDKTLSKAVMESLQGFSPLPAVEIAHRVAEEDIYISESSPAHWVKLEEELKSLKELLIQGKGTPTMLTEEGGRPRDFTYLPVSQYGAALKVSSFNSYGELLDTFYTQRNTTERIRQRSSNLHRLVDNASKRIGRRVAAQKRELEDTKNRQELRTAGDILTANIHTLKQGMKETTLANFYDPENALITLKLHPQKSPAQNAQAYYKQYRKADTAEKILTGLIAQGEQEQLYVDSIKDTLNRAETEGDLEEIREELAQSGYLKLPKKRKPLKIKAKPYEYLSSDGFVIFAGRNNKENDRLTLKDSRSEDLWFHTQALPGSHVLIKTEGKDVPDQTLKEAATIAAYHSKGREGSKVAVDYTEIRHVKKAAGGKPGMVIYQNFKTVLVDPEPSIIHRLAPKELL